jgi:hypothetical protein
MPPKIANATPQEIYDFFIAIMNGDAQHAGIGKEANTSDTIYPTLEQRIKAANTLLGVFETMQKLDAKTENTASALTPDAINALRDAMHRKLARLAALNKKAKVPQEPKP